VEHREKAVTDIDISPQSWSEQSAGLRDSGSAVAEISNAALNTMSGNPYGVLLTPIFQPRYVELSGDFKTTNSALGQVLEATAQALDDSAADFRETEMALKDEFDKLMNSI
jgi:hypothetical protein